MKLLTHPAVVALGLTTLYLLAITGQLVSSMHAVVYHWSGSASDVFVPALLNFAVIWLLLTLLLLFAQRPSRLSVGVWSGLILALPWVLSKNWALLSGRPTPLWLSVLLCSFAIVTFLFLVVSWKPSLQSAFERVHRLMATVLGFAAISAILVLGQLFWFSWKARDLNAVLPLHQRQNLFTSTSSRTRVVWILFDELSYQQVYEQTFPGLQLPAFDRLATQATVFTHTVPAGTMTENVIPSLFSGQPVDRISASSDGHHISIHNPASEAWQRFDQHQTVFQDALNAGYSTGVAGWYNPYCRILPQVLDQCFWTYNVTSIAGMSPAQSITANLLEPLHRAVISALSLVSRLRRTPVYNVKGAELHELDYDEISAAADHLLQDRSADFIFLHMPVPHPGGIYNRKAGTFATSHSTYIDNLALADRYLAHARTLLEQNGSWDSSAVIVMGDHSWRTSFMWAPAPGWTEEEQIASHGGQYDDRPAYIVKLPNQQQPARIDLPYAALHTRSLLDAIMRNQIRSPDDLSSWAQEQRQTDTPAPISSTN